MTWLDHIAEWLHIKLELHRTLCLIGLHWWGYMGEINCWPAGSRHLWRCCRCPAEKWLMTVFE